LIKGIIKKMTKNMNKNMNKIIYYADHRKLAGNSLIYVKKWLNSIGDVKYTVILEEEFNHGHIMKKELLTTQIKKKAINFADEFRY